jgi:hypothetical protein
MSWISSIALPLQDVFDAAFKQGFAIAHLGS